MYKFKYVMLFSILALLLTPASAKRMHAQESNDPSLTLPRQLFLPAINSNPNRNAGSNIENPIGQPDPSADAANPNEAANQQTDGGTAAEPFIPSEVCASSLYRQVAEISIHSDSHCILKTGRC